MANAQLDGGNADKKSLMPHKPPPEDNLEYWLEKLGWNDASKEAECEGEFGPIEKYQIVRDVGDIAEDLRRYAAWDSSFLDLIDRELEKLEILLRQYRSLYFGTKSKPADLLLKDGLSQFPKAFLTELAEKENSKIERLLENERHLRSVLAGNDVNKGKERSINDITVVPSEFQENVIPGLPNQVDPVHVVEVVARHDQGEGTKLWKRFCYTKATLNLLQGTFWWFLLEKFKPHRELQDKLYDIVAKIYVNIIMPLNLHESDKFVQHFPRYLAEAIYVIFCEAYPSSRKNFGGGFCSDLVNLVALWITGLKPFPNCWENWPVMQLFKLSGYVPRQQGSSGINRKDLEKSHVRFQSQDHSTHFKKESHPMGSRMEMERIKFSLFSKSPLVQHYLSIHGLDKETQLNRRGLTRSEVATLPDKSVMLYQDFLASSSLEAERRHNNYEKKVTSLNTDIAKMLKEQVVTLRAMERSNKRLLKKKYEVKLMSEHLLEEMKQFHPSFNSTKTTMDSPDKSNKQ